MLDASLLGDRLSLTYTHLASADDELARVLKRIQRRALTQEQFGELVEWAGFLRIARGLSPNTGANYLEGCALFLEWLNDRQTALEAVTAGDITEWQQGLYLSHGESPSTRNVKLAALRQYFAWRESENKGPSPARSVPGPRRAKRMPSKYSLDQVRRLLGAFDLTKPQHIRDYAVLLMFLHTGARREELAELSLDQLELRAKIGVVRFFGKGAKERVVSFEGAPVEALHAWLAVRDGMAVADPGALFLAMGKREGLRLSNGGMDGVLRRAHKRAKLSMEPGKALHKLRSTFATTLYDHCKDIMVVQVAMGHEDINTTKQYIVISDQQLRQRLPGKLFTGG